MPSYRMKDTKGDERDVSCSISEMVEMKSNGWEVVFVPNSNSIISYRAEALQDTAEATEPAICGKILSVESRQTIQDQISTYEAEDNNFW